MRVASGKERNERQLVNQPAYRNLSPEQAAKDLAWATSIVSPRATAGPRSPAKLTHRIAPEARPRLPREARPTLTHPAAGALTAPARSAAHAHGPRAKRGPPIRSPQAAPTITESATAAQRTPADRHLSPPSSLLQFGPRLGSPCS